MSKKYIVGSAACAAAVILCFVCVPHRDANPYDVRFPFVPKLTSSTMPRTVAETEPRLCGVSYDPANPTEITVQFEYPKTKPLDDETRTRLVRYFLAALTVPDAQQWVNLSPFEGDRVMPAAYAATDAGADILAEDLTLKQAAASATDPRTPLGRTFWKGRDPSAVSFDKIWIVPESVSVERGMTSVRVSAPSFSVQDGKDRVAAEATGRVPSSDDHAYAAVKDLIAKDVSEGERFARLRQVYVATVVAREFRAMFKDVPLVKGYVGANRVGGIDTMPVALRSRMHAVYADAYDRGMYAMTVKEGKALHKYACGGITVLTGSVRARNFTPRRGCVVSEKTIRLVEPTTTETSSAVAVHAAAVERAVAAQFAGVPVVTYVFDPSLGEVDQRFSVMMSAAGEAGMLVRFDLSVLDAMYKTDPDAAFKSTQQFFSVVRSQFSDMKTQLRVDEALRNAFVHGNKADVRYPIWLRVKEGGVAVIDCAVTRARSSEDMGRAHREGLYGGINGLQIASGGLKGLNLVHQSLTDPLTGAASANVFAVQRDIGEYGTLVAALSEDDSADSVISFATLLARQGGTAAVRWVVPHNVMVPDTERSAARFSALVNAIDRHHRRHFSGEYQLPLVSMRAVGQKLFAQVQFVGAHGSEKFVGKKTAITAEIPIVRRLSSAVVIRKHVIGEALTSADSEHVAALEKNLKSIFPDDEWIDVDLWQVSKGVSSLKDAINRIHGVGGRPMMFKIDINGFERAATYVLSSQYGAVADALASIRDLIGGDLGYAAFELSKNAFVHGNALDMRLPVYMRFSPDGGVLVFDIAVDGVADAWETRAAFDESLHGRRAGISSSARKMGPTFDFIHRTVGFSDADLLGHVEGFTVGKPFGVVYVGDPRDTKSSRVRLRDLVENVGLVPTNRTAYDSFNWAIPTDIEIPDTSETRRRISELLQDAYARDRMMDEHRKPEIVGRIIGNRVAIDVLYEDAFADHDRRFEVRGSSLSSPATSDVGGIDLTGGAGRADAAGEVATEPGYSFVFVE